ncbi:zf-HC2 domain-containing protein [Streptomyces sp. NPDC102473]|uniref:zf-HC2 domain-containing protein n=1 Tax=Streptomyces sp. NPDC102473 TaxID=3366180 RepID=UPI0038268D60
MRAIELHRDAGAYALGVLGTADTCRFEEHLTECAACVIQVREFGVVVAHLAVYAHALPPGGAPSSARWRGPGAT